MARLILTATEKKRSFSSWSNAALGKLVKDISFKIGEYRKRGRGIHKVTNASAAVLLISAVVEAGKDSLELRLDGVQLGDAKMGDWVVTISRRDRPPEDPQIMDSLPEDPPGSPGGEIPPMSRRH